MKNIFRKIFSKQKAPSVKSEDNFGIPLTSLSGGSSMSPAQAMRLETVYTCIRDKSETTGRIPIKLYRKKSDGTRERVKQGREFKIWTQEPNEYMGTINFLEFMVQSVETTGAFYAYLNENTRGSVMEVIPFRYQRNVVPQMDINGRVYYTYTTNDNKPGMSFGNEELLIVKLTTSDGYTPISPIAYNSGMLEGAGAAESTYNNLHKNGITSEVYLSTDATLSDPAAERLKKQWDSYRGPKGISSTPILEDGLKIHPLRIAPKDMELLKSREYSVNRICQIFRVPIHRVGGESNSSKDTQLELDEAYMRNGIEPILRKYEEAVNRAFRNRKSVLEIEFNRRAFYAGSPKTMVEVSEKELKGGLCTVNEAREDNQRDPVEGGDVFAVDNNNVTYSTWDKLPEIQEMIYNNQQTVSEDSDEEEE